MTEGLIYTIDEELVHDCLAELDFREKGVSNIFAPRGCVIFALTKVVMYYSR